MSHYRNIRSRRLLADLSRWVLSCFSTAYSRAVTMMAFRISCLTKSLESKHACTCYVFSHFSVDCLRTVLKLPQYSTRRRPTIIVVVLACRDDPWGFWQSAAMTCRNPESMCSAGINNQTALQTQGCDLAQHWAWPCTGPDDLRERALLCGSSGVADVHHLLPVIHILDLGAPKQCWARLARQCSQVPVDLERTLGTKWHWCPAQ